MLERTTRCLQHGGRKVWCPHAYTVRSRRTLHSSFWRHGAGDLELPSWSYSILPNSLFDSASETLPTGSTLFLPINTTSAAEDMVLDFLYPQKTLEFIQRLSRHNIKRLQRRLATKFSIAGFRKYVSGARKTISSVAPASDSAAWPPSELKIEVMPALSDANSSHNALDTLERILHSENKESYRDAWSMFISISQADRNPKMLVVLLKYLSTSSRHVDAKRIQALFDLLPCAYRSETVFLAIIKTYIRIERLGKAVMLHKMAANLSSLNVETSRILLAKLIAHERWQLALEVYDNHLRVANNYGLSPSDVLDPLRVDLEILENYQGSLWQEVSAMPNIMDKVFSLMSVARRFLLNTSSPEPIQLRRFLYHLIQATSGHLTKAPSDLIIAILKDLKHTKLSRSWVFELYCKSLLGPGSIRTALNAYKHYREDSCFEPSTQLLKLLLQTLPRLEDQDALLILLSDWRKHHGVPPESVSRGFMINFARFGDAKTVHEIFDQYVEKYKGKVSVNFLPPILLVHARRLEIEDVERQFARIQGDFGLKPNLVCWNILIHAYGKADDLPQALRCLSLLLDSGLQPDAYSLGPIMAAAASRGDITIIKQIFEIIESRGLEMSSFMLDTLVEAHINNEEIGEAENLVHAALKMPLKGSRTRMWNQLISAFTVRRDTKNALRIYNAMQENGVPLNSMTYASLMRVLTSLKQTGAAWSILSTVMPKADVPVYAVHYAIVLQGFADEMHITMLQHVLRHMQRNKMQPTISIQRAIIKAKAVEDKSKHRASRFRHPGLRLEAADACLEDIISITDRSVIASKQPLIAGGGMTLRQSFPAAYFDVMMSIYNSEQSYDMVKSLVERYTSLATAGKPNQTAELPLIMIRILMKSHLSQNQHLEVERLWLLAKESMRRRFGDGKTTPFSLPKPQQYSLSRHLDIYMKVVFTQAAAFNKLQNLVEDYVAEGFTMSHQNLNLYVRLLAQAGRKLQKPEWISWVNIPFEVCESQLMEQWPGWLASRGDILKSFKTLRSPGTQYLDLKFLAPGQRVATFETLKTLRQLLAEQKSKAVVSMSHRRALASLQKRTPRTMEAIYSMPRPVLSVGEVRHVQVAGQHGA